MAFGSATKLASTPGQSTTPGTTNTITLTANAPAGQMIYVCCAAIGTNGVTSITDTNGQTYTRDKTFRQGLVNTTEVWSCPNPSGLVIGNTIVLTVPTADTTVANAYTATHSRVVSVDATDSAGGTSATPSDSITTATDNTLIFVCLHASLINGAAAITSSGTFSTLDDQEHATANLRFFTEFFLKGSAGAQAWDCSMPASVVFADAMVSYKEASNIPRRTMMGAYS